MGTPYVVINSNGANVRTQMSTLNPFNIVRVMGTNEGFVVHETYNISGMSGLQVWGRISDNPGGQKQEYVCLSIGNKVYCKLQETPLPMPENWAQAIDVWARSIGYTGPRP